MTGYLINHEIERTVLPDNGGRAYHRNHMPKVW